MKGLGLLGDGCQPKSMETEGTLFPSGLVWESRSDPGVRPGLQAEGEAVHGVSSRLRPRRRRVSQEDRALHEGGHALPCKCSLSGDPVLTAGSPS